MLPMLEIIQEQLEDLKDALSSQNGLDEAIERYEDAIAVLPAEYGWRVEYGIRDAIGLNFASSQKRKAIKGWKHYFSLKKSYDPLDALEKRPKLAVVFLCHNDGFVREEALRYVHYNKMSPFVIALICARLNDWVPEVRLQAFRAFTGLLEHVDHDDLRKLIQFLFIRSARWERWVREKPKFVEIITAPHFVVRMEDMMIRATHGPVSRCLAMLTEYSEYDAILLSLQRSAAQPALRERATRILLDGYASIFRGYQRSRRFELLESINESLGISNPVFMRGDVNSRRVRIFEQRPLTIDYSKATVLAIAAQDKSPFVRRHAADFLIAHRNDIELYQDTLTLLRDDTHNVVKTRMDFLLRELEE